MWFFWLNCDNTESILGRSWIFLVGATFADPPCLARSTVDLLQMLGTIGFRSNHHVSVAKGCSQLSYPRDMESIVGGKRLGGLHVMRLIQDEGEHYITQRPAPSAQPRGIPHIQPPSVVRPGPLLRLLLWMCRINGRRR